MVVTAPRYFFLHHKVRMGKELANKMDLQKDTNNNAKVTNNNIKVTSNIAEETNNNAIVMNNDTKVTENNTTDTNNNAQVINSKTKNTNNNAKAKTKDTNNNAAHRTCKEMPFYKQEILPWDNMGMARAVLAEYFGTMFFVFCVTIANYAITRKDGGGLLATGITSGLAFAVLVAITIHVSGGHLNPFVTLGVFCAGAIHPILAAMYVLAQLLGGVFGSLLTYGVLGYDKFEQIWGGANALSDGVSVGEGIISEMMFTAILVTVVLFTAVDEITSSILAPLAIGFAVMIGVLAGVHSRGSSMNAARAFGPAVVMAGVSGDFAVWDDHYVFWVGPIVGVLIAVILYRIYDWLKPQPDPTPVSTPKSETPVVVVEEVPSPVSSVKPASTVYSDEALVDRHTRI